MRTVYAAILAVIGMMMIMYSVVWDGGQTLYYAGILLVFTAVWMNGSMSWFYFQVKSALKGLYQRERRV